MSANINELRRIINSRRQEIEVIDESITELNQAIQDAKSAIAFFDSANSGLARLEGDVSLIFKGKSGDAFLVKVNALRVYSTNRRSNMENLIRLYSNQIERLNNQKSKSQRIINDLFEWISTIQNIDLK